MPDIQHGRAAEKESAEGSRETISNHRQHSGARGGDHGAEGQVQSNEQIEPEAVTEAERQHGAGKFGRLAGPRPPNRSEDVETPVIGVVPPDPNMPDEVGDMDLTRGDPTRVREAPRGSARPDGEHAADEELRRKLYQEGATEVSEE